MGMSTTFANGLLLLLFQATGIAQIADNAASSPLTSLFISLHTADPGTGGDQTTNEVAYTSYARVAVARTSAGWAVAGDAASPVANIVFASPTGNAGQTATHIAIGHSLSGSGVRYLSGPLTPQIPIQVGTPPTITTGSQIVFT